MTIRYSLGCDLSYDVKSPTVFIFNLEVAKLVRHHDLVERLTITPRHNTRTYIVPDIRNRYFSLDAETGPLNVRYEAEVTLEVYRSNPITINETPLNAIPLDIMPFFSLPALSRRTDLPLLRRRNLARFREGIVALQRSATGFTTISSTSEGHPTRPPRRARAL